MDVLGSEHYVEHVEAMYGILRGVREERRDRKQDSGEHEKHVMYTPTW